MFPFYPLGKYQIIVGLIMFSVGDQKGILGGGWVIKESDLVNYFFHPFFQKIAINTQVFTKYGNVNQSIFKKLF